VKATKILQLPAYLRQLRRDVDELYRHVQKLNYRVVDEAQEIRSAIEGRLNRLDSETEQLRIRNAELEHRILNLKHAKSPKTTAGKETDHQDLFADNHDLDSFYLEFENQLRGNEKETKEKQLPYIKVLEKAKIDKKLPVVDLGCGRGEFLELLKERGFMGIGVDLNEAMVKRAQERGFEAVEGDGIGYLAKQKSGSLAGVTGFHLAEHIPFDQVLLLMAEAYRCLAKGGVLLLETPNPESVFVGAFTFHFDPSHLKPLPPAVMQFSARFKGFNRAEIIRLRPELTKEEIVKATKNQTLQDALQRLYGPRDYALVAYK
jgi:SAM-dependent methyltransferase